MQSAQASESRQYGFYALAVYLFLIFSRFQEYLADFVGSGFYLSLIFGTLALVLAFLSGRVRDVAVSRQGILLLLFTVWIMMATLMSTWKGGSVNLLTQFWFKSLITFVVTGAMIASLKLSRQAIYTVAFGCLVAEAATMLLGANHEGRFELAGGSLGNANGLAFHVVVGMPFLYLMLVESSGIWKVAAIGGLAYGVLVTIKTGSRAGLIQLSVLLLIIFFRLSMTKKLAFGLGAVGLAVVGIGLAPQETLDRYKTLLSDDTSSASYASALQSGESRKERLVTSLKVTLEHPLFGVGPGVFASATAEEEKLSGRSAVWRQTHNAYTQLSAETGIPGFLLYMAAMFTCLRAMFGLFRRTRHKPETRHISNIAFSVFLSLVVFAMNGVTDSNAYQYYFPFLAGLAFAVLSAANRELAAMTVPAKQETAVSRAETPASALVERRPAPMWIPGTNAVRVPGGSRLNRKLGGVQNKTTVGPRES